MKQVPLVGKYRHRLALVDDEDFDAIAGYSWTLAHRGQTTYARRRWVEGGRHKGQYLHVLLTGWQMVDHINGDGLDNRRENLRPVRSLENNRNSQKPKTYCGRQPSSVYKGVSRRGSRWRAVIKVNYRQLNLGSFVEEIDAARAYDRAAKQHFGEYARLNFPEKEVNRP